MLDTVDAHRAILEHNPGDREALVTVRRQFHTLKGSGRMVGLTELGELAWGVERSSTGCSRKTGASRLRWSR